MELENEFRFGLFARLNREKDWRYLDAHKHEITWVATYSEDMDHFCVEALWSDFHTQPSPMILTCAEGIALIWYLTDRGIYIFESLAVAKNYNKLKAGV